MIRQRHNAQTASARSGVARSGLVPGLMLTLLGCWIASPPPARAEEVSVGHGVAMHGDLKYGPDFTHFEYADPQAPKGGDVRRAAIGTFNSLNRFILKGVPAEGIGGTFDTLTVHSGDEPFSEYGLIAETIEMPEDRSWVAFTLRPEARFHDATPVTPEDVIFTFETLKTRGHPFYRAYYAAVVEAEKIGERKVRFDFVPGENRELPLIMGQLPVLSKAYYETRDFEKTTLEAPLGSGPYAVELVDPGRSITYRRVSDYWGKDLPVNRGRFNFGRVRFDYYRDATVAVEALKAGEFDFRAENSSKDWATAYKVPVVDRGLLRMELVENERPTGMQGFFFNTRRPFFRDPRVRQALAHGFDFEWSNKNLFYGAYARTESYFSNSELAATGLPSDEELAILEPYRGHLPDEVFSQVYQAPKSDGSGNIRSNLRRAMTLLKEADWEIKNKSLVERDTGEAMVFEILLVQPTWERITLPFARNLERLGIEVRVRTVDTAQYQNRIDEFDFDMIVGVIGQSLSPGNEQRDFFSSEKADQPGSRNYAGIADPVVDALISQVIAAPDRESLVHRTRALDRVLLWGQYVVPHWHITAARLVYWDKFGRPAIDPKFGIEISTWWVDPAKEEALARNLGESKD